MGTEDNRPADIREHYERSRAHDAPRAWVWLPGQKHWPEGVNFTKNTTALELWRAWVANDIVLPWTETLIQQRFPNTPDGNKTCPTLKYPILESGWLGDVETGDIVSYQDFRGDVSKAS